MGRRYVSAEAVERIANQARAGGGFEAALRKLAETKKHEAVTLAGFFGNPDSGVDVIFRKVPERCQDCPFYVAETDGCELGSAGIPSRYALSSEDAAPEWCPARGGEA